MLLQTYLCCTGVWTRLTKKMQHFKRFMHLGYLLTVYKRLLYFWLTMTFSDNGLTSCHYTCHYKAQRKNNIDWKPRGLWITYWARFISAASSWHMQTPACCPVCAKKIMAFSRIWKTFRFFTLMLRFAPWRQITQFFWSKKVHHCTFNNKCYRTNNKILHIFTVQQHNHHSTLSRGIRQCYCIINTNSLFLPGFQTWSLELNHNHYFSHLLMLSSAKIWSL